MTADQLIIEDFDFQNYPIVRIYPLGNKTVIQIGESSIEPRSKLLDEIDDQALASTIDDQNKTIADLEEQLLAAQEN